MYELTKIDPPCVQNMSKIQKHLSKNSQEEPPHAQVKFEKKSSQPLEPSVWVWITRTVSAISWLKIADAFKKKHYFLSS